MHIVIPMSGKGQRFVDAGYTIPKPLIVVDGKPMIQHVLDLTPGENKITFICNQTHLTTTNMKDVLISIIPNCNIVQINDHDLGPVYTILQAIDHIDDDEEILINHCDFGTFWDYDDFLKHTRERDADGVIASYKGFHPHMLGTTKYASMRDDKQWMIEIKEKGYFTDDPMSEYVSNGTYYFKKGSYVKKYFQELIDLQIDVGGEFFISLVYNLLKRDSLKVSLFEIQHMLQWGNPGDVDDYNSWSDYFKNIINQRFDFLRLTSDVNLILVDNDDDKYLKAGFSMPKLFVDVGGKPMALQAASYFPSGHNTMIAYAYKENIDSDLAENKMIGNFNKIQIVKNQSKDKNIVDIAFSGLGHINGEVSLQISATDNGVLFNQKKYMDLLNDMNVDAIVWTSKHYRPGEDYPERYDWAKTDKTILKKISIRKKISTEPYFDHMLVGTFYFRKVKYFKETYLNLKDKQQSDNEIISVEDIVNRMIHMKYKIKIFEVDNFVSWKTPDELKTFQYWQSFFHKVDWHPYKLECDNTVKKEAIQRMDKQYCNFKQEYR